MFLSEWESFSAWVQHLRDIWPQLTAVLHFVLAVIATAHAVMTKEDSRSAVGWVGLIWLSPILGAVFYYLLGINRIRRKAVAIMGPPEVRGISVAAGVEILREFPEIPPHFRQLVQVGDNIVGFPLTAGNRITPLLNGEEAYPAMQEAIRSARHSVGLSTYIFDNDDAGREFSACLGDAVKRGVQVRVLIDATGARYSIPTMIGPLREAGVAVRQFMPNLSPARVSAVNLRTHRKLLIVDGETGFTGGMNIRQGHYVGRGYRHPVQDLHFKVEGPVVGHMRRAFQEDWAFAAREALDGPAWMPPLKPAGRVLARGVLDGPDKDFEKILWTLYAAISSARHSIRIVTPYFLPEPTMVRFLSIAAMSGVSVDVIIPSRNNIRLVEWASMAVLPGLLARGCRVWRSDPPFDHTKLMLVDDAWVFIGSSNWDIRSLRLNFEFNVECFDREFAARMGEIFARKLAASRQLIADELRRRPLAVRLRDSSVRLLAPYL